MDASRVHLLRELLATTGWVDRSRSLARSLRQSAPPPGGFLLVGTPQSEPWHLAAHLDDEARFSGVRELSPTLVRWNPPTGAPPHLRVGLDRLTETRRGETLFVVAPDAAPEQLLERVSDARRVGATILSLDEGDPELGDLAHDRLVVPRLVSAAEAPVTAGAGAAEAIVDMEVVQHLVSLAAGEEPARPSSRDRLARFLERISGAAPQR